VDPCPADHILDLEHMARAHQGTVEGLVREYSFLENPRAPAELKQSRQLVAPPPHLGENALDALRTPSLRATRVLHFATMPDLYATLPAAEALVEQQRMKSWTSMWCCSKPLAPKAPGHIWYDLFWDVVPHTNRHNQLVNKPWEPSFGP